MDIVSAMNELGFAVAADLLKQIERGATVETAVRIVGLLFARPTSELAKNEILPNLNYFHHRSGEHVTFYLPGYYQRGLIHGSEDMMKKYAKHRRWEFSDSQFNTFREDFARQTTWTYSGGVDLILANATLCPRGYERGPDGTVSVSEYIGVIDYSSALCANLTKMKAVKAIDSVESFFEEIFRYAERQTGLDPTWGFSDDRGIKIAGSALKSLVLSIVPKAIKHELERAPHFAVRNIERNR